MQLKPEGQKFRGSLDKNEFLPNDSNSETNHAYFKGKQPRRSQPLNFFLRKSLLFDLMTNGLRINSKSTKNLMRK